MIQNKKRFFKRAVEMLVLVLGIFSAFLFGEAVFCGRKIDASSGQDTRIHVFINQNDSVVTKLQKDVEHLSSLIEKMKTDTVTIEIRKLNTSE
ncbi:MAG: hypothetical protein UDS46_04360 [Bacteroidales bacterium]|nr:hypothetical protein [Bacteroidales bacterium]